MKLWPTIILTACLLLLTFAAGYLGPAPTLGPLENIHGIPYPNHDSTVTITEQLAHVDLYLNQPVLANTATVTVDFTPHNIQTLAIGIRENDFWLSYPRTTLYHQSQPATRQQKTVTIPLTNKLQEADQSLDMMFFASTNEHPDIDPTLNSLQDTTTWQLHELSVDIQKTPPTIPHARDYVRSIITRERPL